MIGKQTLYKLIPYILLMFISFSIYSQDHRKNIDSLLTEINTNGDKAGTFISLSWNYLRISLDSSQLYANKAFELALISDVKKDIADAYHMIGVVYAWKLENDKAIEYYNKSLELKLELNDLKGLNYLYGDYGYLYESLKDYELANEYYNKGFEVCKTINNERGVLNYSLAIGDTYYNLNNYKNTIKYYKIALEIAQKLEQKSVEAYIRNWLGHIYSILSNSEKALKQYFEALELFKELNDQSGLSMLYNNLGIIYHDLNEDDKALIYYKKSLSMEIISENKAGQAMEINNIGTIYDKKGDFEKALEYYNQALKLNKELDSNPGMALAYSNLGYIYMVQGKYEKANTNFIKSLEINEELNDVHNLGSINNNLATLKLRQKNYSEANNYLKKGLQFAKQAESMEFMLESYSLYSELYSELKNYKKALEYFKLYSEIKDSMHDAKSSDKVLALKANFEADFLENENEILKKDNEIYLLDLQQQKNLKNFWISFSILILALTILGFNQVRLKKKSNRLLEVKNNQLKEANEKLTISEQSLKDLNTTKDKFFSIISHDLKNPFQTLLGFSELLYKNQDKLGKDSISQYSNLIHESSQNIYSLLSNLLEWSKLQLDSISISHQNINLYDSLNEILELHYIASNSKNIAILNLIHKNIEIIADKHTLFTVLRNLISNSIKFTDKGGEISISAKFIGEKITISVTDSGKGISPENIHKLFKIEETHSTTGTEKEMGTGLGLILCHDLIKKSKGEFFIESELDKGSTFSFTLPLNPHKQ